MLKDHPVALPEGCDHIPWRWEQDPTADPVHPSDGARLLTQFATWIAEPDGVSAEEPVRRAELAAQGLTMVGEPHLCQTMTSARQLWAVEVVESAADRG